MGDAVVQAPNQIDAKANVTSLGGPLELSSIVKTLYISEVHDDIKNSNEVLFMRPGYFLC